jgi:tRNA threonylcarbamoyladenosine biosynthesis protein TsaE
MKETFFLGEEDLGTLAEKATGILASYEKPSASVIVLEGDLGAGKTTFTKALAEHLGIDKESVHSPTFILKKEYKASHPTFKKLVHVDAYRFNEPEEAKILRLEDDMKDPSTLIVVEWPSRMTYLKPDVLLSFIVEDEKMREIHMNYEEGH